MALWFIRGLARRRVTTRFPAVIDPWVRTLPSPPTFNSSLLTLTVADKLVECCPSRALSHDERWLVFDVGACTSCGTCQRVVPEATGVSGVFELAARTSAQLLRRFPLQVGDR